MSAPRVSGCIVSYRCYEKCRAAVASLYEHTQDAQLTLYVVDNCSGDDTLQKLQAEFPQLIVIENDANKGFGHGHNAVLPYLDSDYHAVINPDIELGCDAVSALCSYLEQHPDVGIVTPQILFPDGRDQQLPKRNPPFLALFGRHLFQQRLRPVVEHYQMLDEDLTKPIDIEFATGCFFIIRTDLFKKLGGFDERFFMYFEDMDITRRVLGAGSRAVYYPYTYVYHAWERSSNKSPKFFAILVLSMFKYYLKWGFQLR